MKFLFLNLLIIVLLLIYKVSSASYLEENNTECHLYYHWIGKDPNDFPKCCDGSNAFMCNDNDRVNSLIVSPKYYDHPNFSTFPIFEQLTKIKIYDYGRLTMQFVEPFDLDINIFKQPSLKILIVDSVYAVDIASDIDPNCPLEELTLNNTQIENLPNSLFKLKSLKKIELGNNSLMNVKIVKFKNSPIECNFENTTIDCYQEGACSNIFSSEYRKCSEDEINEILGKEEVEVPVNQTKSDNENASSSGNKNKNNGFLIKSIISISIILFYLL